MLMNLRKATVIFFMVAAGSLSTATSQSAANPQGSTADRKHGSLLLTEFQIPAGARVATFEIDLAGHFESISNVPPGWQVSIDNVSAGQSHLVARAKPDAAPLSEASFRNIGLQVAELEVDDARLQVSGYFTLILATGESKRVPLNNYSFRFLERYHRHRLSADAIQP